MSFTRSGATWSGIASFVAVTDASGAATWGLPIPANLQPFDLYSQVAQVVPNGPWLGSLALSNGVRIRVGGSGCQ